MLPRFLAKLRLWDGEDQALVDLPFIFRLSDAWKEAARRVGVTAARRRGTAKDLAFRGFAGRLAVTFEVHPTRDQPGTLLTVRDRGRGSDALSIVPQKRAIEPGSRLGRLEIEIGDPAFDAEFSIQGDPRLAQAGLDVHTRTKLTQLLRGRVESPRGLVLAVDASLERGKLSVFVEHDQNANQEQLEEPVAELLEMALSVVRSLAKRADLPTRLANHLGSDTAADPETGVRLRSLRMLVRDFPRHRFTRKALETARTDPNEEVRLEGAIAEGTRGWGTILSLISNPGISDDCSARAVQTLGEGLPVELAASVLRQALATGRPALACALLAAPCWNGQPGAEGHVVTALASPDAAVAGKAADALGRLGTAAAVPALRRLGERNDRELQRAARQSIAAIQARLQGAEQGQISLAGSGDGALSLVGEDEAGQLSLVDARDRG